MTYTKQTWANGEAGGTPVSAARLNYLENGLEAVGLEVDLKEDSIPPGTYVDTTTDQDKAGGLRMLNDLLTKSGRPRFDARSFGATGAQRAVFGNGLPKPMSGFYGSLGAAQAAYPVVGALTDELDWAIAQTAINAAMTATDPMVGGGRIGWGPLYFDYGTFLVNRPLSVLSVSGFYMAGVGYGTEFRCTPGVTMTNVLAINGAAFSVFKDFRVNGPIGSGQVDCMLDWYWDGTQAARSSSGCVFENLWVGGATGRSIAGFGISRIGTGTPQVDHASFRHVTVTGGGKSHGTLWQKGLHVGTGVSGNQTDYYFFGTGVSQWATATHMATVKMLTFKGGSWGSNGTAFYDSGSFDVHVEGINFEGCDRLLDQSGASSAPSTFTIKDLEWDLTSLPVDGELVRYYRPGHLILENIRCQNPPTTGAPLNFRLTPSASNDLTVIINGFQSFTTLTNLFTAAKMSGPVRVILHAYTQLDVGTSQTSDHWPGPVHFTTTTLTTDHVLDAYQAGDTVPRMTLLSNGGLSMGPGNAAQTVEITPSGTSLVARVGGVMYYDSAFGMVFRRTSDFETILSVATSVSAGQAALLVMVNDGTVTSLRQVTVGAADSGGAGFRVLRVAN